MIRHQILSDHLKYSGYQQLPRRTSQCHLIMTGERCKGINLPEQQSLPDIDGPKVYNGSVYKYNLKFTKGLFMSIKIKSI